MDDIYETAAQCQLMDTQYNQTCQHNSNTSNGLRTAFVAGNQHGDLAIASVSLQLAQQHHRRRHGARKGQLQAAKTMSNALG